MHRSILLLLALALMCGCKKADPDKPTPSETDTGGTPKQSGPNPGAVPEARLDLTGLKKLQPKAKFKLPASISSRIYRADVQLSADGKTLALLGLVESNKPTTQVWDISGEAKMVAEFPKRLLALSPSGKFVATGDSSFAVYEIATKKLVSNGPAAYYSHGFFRDDNTLVVSKPTEDAVTVWDVTKDAKSSSFDIPDRHFRDALPANGRKEVWLVLTENKFEVACYDLDGKKLLRTVKPESATNKGFLLPGSDSSIAPDASVFAATDIKTHFYDAATGKIVGTLPADIGGTAQGFIPGGNCYLARVRKSGNGLAESDFVIYDWKAKKGLAVVTGHSAGEKYPSAAASGDGKTLVSVSQSGEALVFDISAVK